jgi:ELWxxDGT repeat protein
MNIMIKLLKILPALLSSTLVVLFLFYAIPILGGLQKSYAATPLLIDINSGTGDSSVDELVDVNGTLYFRADDGINGSELWRSDGTVDGTLMVKDIYVGIDSGYPRNLTNVNGVLYFTADSGINGSELWKSDGTEEGTIMVKNFAFESDPSYLTNVDGTLFFWIDNALWKSDGTPDGTLLVKI